MCLGWGVQTVCLGWGGSDCVSGLGGGFRLCVWGGEGNTQWGLYGSSTATAVLSDLQLLRLHSFFKCHRSGWSSVWSRDPASPQLLRLHTQGIKAALQSSNLGVWAKLVEARLPHLPYQAHPVLQLLRGISHQHFWCPSAPPPGVLIYAMIHVHMLCIYVGKTTLPLLQRLRKHGTTADACAEDSSFHEMPRATGLAEWTRIPFHFTTDEIRACYLERDWWSRLKRWALNDCAPAVRGETSPSQTPAAQHTKRLNTLVRQLQTATHDQYFFFVKQVQSHCSRVLRRPAHHTM